MKKCIFLLFTIPFLLTSCSGSTDLQDFNHDDLKKRIEDQYFYVKLPTKLPFEVREAEFSKPPIEKESIKTLIIDFLGEHNEHIGLQITNSGNVSSVSEKDYKEVKIGNVQGKYYTNNAGTKLLKWTQNDVHYTLKYFAKQSETKVTQKDLMEVSKSFK
ncbi:DUF4367 domain-containing protein [Pontibacillus yanchengensis]|uniref:DUF4367 domain-containing protein n=2 Tax=Pontibacillus yanchengensis TaxID=462910 RepID=A0ACC7VC55_9BACI|nr:DUF4367 domain-containing protein [Pontibacillus yanchengensis]MYL35142.1 DUF4367 domain-containing protein [Pontibacillus yanchengensis]MYL52491.1 DUF4367 domain-containing protein [Pontibacillus yanchengensis]